MPLFPQRRTRSSFSIARAASGASRWSSSAFEYFRASCRRGRGGGAHREPPRSWAARPPAAGQAGEAYAMLADVVIRALHREAERIFSATYGRMRGAETAVLALGKLGGREMTAGSDLDLILLYDFDPRLPSSDGKRPLDGAQYFARLTKRLVSALTTPTNEGKLYDVDLRLRPSGRSGPVATGLAGFALYSREK